MDNNQHDLAAFCDSNDITVPATSPGELDGLNFATKDVMDVAGSITGFGQPEWLRTHAAATQHARVVEQLLGAGAAMARKTVTDELSYSLTGENVHYGTPVNSAARGRVCGGSSSGSAAAVAAGLVDFALGTDCAGSVRLPASYCGLYGMRPSHNQVSTDGVIPFAPSFDTVGWLARDADVLNRAGRVLLQGQSCKRGESEIAAHQPRRLVLANDCFDLVDSQVKQALMPAVQNIASCVGDQSEVVVSESGLEPWMECFRTIQGYEIWQSLGSWIETNKPNLGPGVDERVEAASKVSLQECEAAREFRQTVIARLTSILQPGDVLCLPSSPRVAPLRDTATSTVEVTYRYQAICLLSIAGLGGLPEISLPLCRVEGLPLGVSLVGARGTDLELLDLACRIRQAS